MVVHEELAVVGLGHKGQKLTECEHVASAVQTVIDDDPLHSALGLDLIEVVDEQIVGVLELLLGGRRFVVLIDCLE